MEVAILYSGGKDSTFAIHEAKKNGWNIKYLLSVKPSTTECFLFHFATVENTPVLAGLLGIPHKLIQCNVIGAKEEAVVVRDAVLSMPKVDALILGGTGLQLTQIKSLQDALLPHNIEVFAAHAGLDHDKVMREMLSAGNRFIIAQIASDGLDESWLGRELTPDVMSELFSRSQKFGFHCGGEGGYYDTFTVDSPLFSSAVKILASHRVMESKISGHLVIDALELSKKPIISSNAPKSISSRNI